MTREWAVAWVEAGSELQTAEAMRRASWEVFCPALKYTQKYRAGRNPRVIETAIMPTYLFVDFATIHDSEAAIRDMRAAGFRYWLMFAGEWVLLPDEALDGFREIVSMKVAEARKRNTAMPFEIGARVKGVVGTLISAMKGRVELAIPGYVTVAGGDFDKPMTVPVDLLELDGD